MLRGANPAGGSHGRLLKGSLSHKLCPEASAFERAQYMRAVGVHKSYGRQRSKRRNKKPSGMPDPLFPPVRSKCRFKVMWLCGRANRVGINTLPLETPGMKRRSGRILTLPQVRRPPARRVCKSTNQERRVGDRRSATRLKNRSRRGNEAKVFLAPKSASSPRRLPCLNSRWGWHSIIVASSPQPSPPLGEEREKPFSSPMVVVSQCARVVIGRAEGLTFPSALVAGVAYRVARSSS